MSDQTLLSLVEQLDQLDSAATIFAVEPWVPRAAAKLVHEEVDTTEPRNGFAYFLEIEIAQEVLSSLVGVSSEGQCERLIQYAINDC